MIFTEKPVDFKPKIEVVSCFVEHAGKILMLCTGSHKKQAGKWGVPAGKMEPGEQRIPAMLRELYEETGIHCSPEQLQNETTVFVRYPDHDFTYHMYTLRCEALPEIRLTDEHSAYDWHTPHEALTLPLILDEEPCIRLVYDIK